MSWDSHHSKSEKLAVEAEAARRAGDYKRAEDLYQLASAEEALALNDLPPEKQRTRGVTAVSAVALSYKAREYERLAYQYLTKDKLSPFATAQLRDFLQVIWTAQAGQAAGIRFCGDILVSVKGGEIMYGGAPLELIIQKIEGIKAVLFRTVEMLLRRPLRKRGGPKLDVQSMFRPWLFQAPAGSYQFAVRVEEPRQRELWEQPEKPKIEEVTETFFRVLRATADDPENDLLNVVPDKEYREAFLNLSRNLAPSPTAKSFDRLEVHDAMAPDEPIASFAVDTRERLNMALQRSKAHETTSGSEVVIQGTLRALHLDKDWLEIATTTDDAARIRVDSATEVLDDVIGPMVNRRVIVRAVKQKHKYLYRDIELDE
ncbi:MAG TPA: hypothetical protein VGY99_07805 [Candidatus Binataceae bacterium]|nr:hypothetical protein [Candidatus Binataceae bacterium]